MDIAKVKAWVELAIKAEIHAFIMIGAGALLCLRGHQTEGMMLISAGCVAFKGQGGQGAA